MKKKEVKKLKKKIKQLKMCQKPKHECWNYKYITQHLERYVEGQDTQNWVSIPKILTATQRDKEQILLALEYLHNNWTIDSDFIAVNLLIHLYEHPECIEVITEEQEPSHEETTP